LPGEEEVEKIEGTRGDSLEALMTLSGFIERPLQGDADFWRIRQLLLDTYWRVPAGFNWEIRNWEGMWFYDPVPGWDPAWEAAGRVWEKADGQLVGALHPDRLGVAVLELDPDYRELLEPVMVAQAEETIAVRASDDPARRRLRLLVYEYDSLRQRLLAGRGYHKLGAGGVTRRLRFGEQALPARQALAEGYRLRSTRPGDARDAAAIATLLNAAFNRDFHNAAEYLTFSSQAPSFRQDLDLVAVAPDGTFAAYVGIPYVAEIGHGVFEPVCTHPEHRRRRLAQVLMVEGLYRLQALGAEDVVVETGDMIPANRLYDSLGFSERDQAYVWERIMDG
jgi:ribosomal protein S18 acetylase RimI-like enzyme